MKNIQYPVKFTFNITSISNDFTASDATGAVIAYVRQKMFKLKETIVIYSDRSKSNVLFTIKADRWLDWSAAYSLRDANGSEIGKIARKGWKSMWKATYEIFDQHKNIQYHVNEHSVWARFADGIAGDIPILGFFTGYLFHPSYDVSDLKGNVVVRLHKRASFFGRRFEVEKTGTIMQDDSQRVMLGLMMMILLERERG